MSRPEEHFRKLATAEVSTPGKMSQSEGSPNKAWRKPSQVMKVRMKRHRSSTGDLSSKSSLSLSDQSQLGPRASVGGGGPGESRAGKRRNPFGSGGAGGVSRRRVQSEIVGGAGASAAAERTGELERENRGDRTGHQKLFRALDSQLDEVFDEKASERMSQAIRRLKAEEEEEPKPRSPSVPSQPGRVAAPLAGGSPTLPSDWCLRTRLRFTSQRPFTWCLPVRMKEEARGLCAFVQGQPASHQQEEETVEESRWRSRLQQATMCWMHPNLPWLSLFPRVIAEPKTFKQSIAAKDPVIASALLSNWCESFRSVFHLLRSDHCPYFYLCTHHFTVLFRGPGIAAGPTLHALMTPTTKGLREALKTEGICFSMPLLEETPSKPDPSQPQDKAQDQPLKDAEPNQTSSAVGVEDADVYQAVLQQSTTEKTEAEEEEEEEVDLLCSPSKASSWLQSMGLDKTKFPSLEPTRVKFQTNQLLKLDNRPQSMVLVEGPDTQALFNFLLNSRTVVTSVGPLADIPPTILAPMAFKGATLHSCKVKSGVMKQQSHHESLEEVHSLEVTGPIMPHNIHGLCSHLNETQEGAFNMVLGNHEATAPFTASTHVLNSKSWADGHARSRDSVSDSRIIRSNSGLSADLFDFLEQKCSINAPVKDIACRGGLYY